MATQKQIADHLGMSERNLREVLKNLKIDHKTNDIDQIRLAYIDDLRKKAAGHLSKSGDDVVQERVLTERVDREIKLLTLQEKLGVLVSKNDVTEVAKQSVISTRIELNSLKQKISNHIHTKHGIEISPDFLDESINAVLRKLSGFAAKFGDIDQ